MISVDGYTPDDGNVMAPSARSLPPAACPQCHTPGKHVPGQTVKALLAISLRQVPAVDYHFCAVASCPVVYFSATHQYSFTTEQLREPVYQKQPGDSDVCVCYCFRHRLGAIRTALHAQQTSIIADITDGIKADQCACDLRNPQGSCCLGNVRALIKQEVP